METKKIKTALISVYHKDDLEEIVRMLDSLGVSIVSTGGTQEFIENLGIRVTAVETMTGYPSILGGRVKTLHPKVFGVFWPGLAWKKITGNLNNMLFPR